MLHRKIGAGQRDLNEAAHLFKLFFSIQWKGSKPFTSPAILQSKLVVSKCVIGAMPLTPATRFFQLSSVPMPSAQTSPTPVTTTRCVTVSPLLSGFRGTFGKPRIARSSEPAGANPETLYV